MHRFRFYLQAVQTFAGERETGTHIEYAPNAAAALAQARARSEILMADLDPADLFPDAVRRPASSEGDLFHRMTEDERRHVLAILALQSGARTAADVVAFLDQANGMDPTKSFGARVMA